MNETSVPVGFPRCSEYFNDPGSLFGVLDLCPDESTLDSFFKKVKSRAGHDKSIE